MNIMKTNLLVLDDKIRKENGDNTTVTTEAPVPQSTNPQAGMNALMFQGLKNLMENPELAQEAGIKNEEPKTTDETAKSYVVPYSSNIAFGKGSKLLNTVKAMTVASLFAAGVASTTSCTDKVVVEPLPPIEKPDISITVTVTNESTNAAISALQTVLLQMLAQQKLTNEQFAEYMKKTEEWRAQTSAQITDLQGQINALHTVLLSMGNDIIDIKNGVDENNAAQQAFLVLLQQYGYTSSQALALLQKAIDIAKQNGKTVADGMAYLINSLNTIHNDLTTIIGQLDNANKQREEQKNILNIIAITGQATKEQVEALNANMLETNKTIKDMGYKFLAQLEMLGAYVVDAIGTLAEMNQCSRDDILRGLAAIGVKIDANTIAQYVTNEALSAQLRAAIAKLDKLDQDMLKAKEEFKDDVAGYATRVIELLESIDAQLSAFVSEWTQSRDALFAKVDSLNDYAEKIYKEEKYQSDMMDKFNNHFRDIKKQMKADHILLEKVYEKMQNNPSSITKEDLEAIAEQLGVSITTSIDDLAALVAQDIKQGETREQQLDKVIEKLGKLATLSQSTLEAIQNLDANNVNELKNLFNKLVDLENALNNLSGKVDKYADLVLKAHNKVVNILNGVADDISDIKTDVSGIKAEVQKSNIELISVNSNLVSLQNYVKQLEAKLGRTITPEELDKILSDHDADNQEFYANLIKSININPKDYTSALDYIAELIKVLVTGQGQTNQYLLDLLGWAEGDQARLDEIIRLIKSGEFKIVVTCQCDCDGNKDIHEGHVTVIEVKENKDFGANNNGMLDRYMTNNKNAYDALMNLISRA